MLPSESVPFPPVRRQVDQAVLKAGDTNAYCSANVRGKCHDDLLGLSHKHSSQQWTWLRLMQLRLGFRGGINTNGAPAHCRCNRECCQGLSLC